MSEISAMIFVLLVIVLKKKPRRGFAPGFVNKKGCTRLTVASDKVYLLFAHGQWFSLDTPHSPTTKTGRHEIAKILPKVALKHQK